jgi:hypothetical protein
MQGQSKNTIKSVLTVLILAILGEGVLGWGLYWPFLLVLLNWSGVYWLALGVGILISVLRGVSVGLPSLYMLVVVGGLSLVMNARKEIGWVMVVIGVLANVIFDVVFGFDWSIWEVLAVTISGIVAVSWFERSETIRINY